MLPLPHLHRAEADLTHLGEADGLLAINVDLGTCGRDTSDDPQGRGSSGDCAAAGLLGRMEKARPRWIPDIVLLNEITERGYSGGISQPRRSSHR